MSGRESPTPPRAALTSDAVSEETFDIVESSLRDLWTVVDDLSRIRPPTSKYYRVTIFGSSRMRPGHQLYADTRRLAAALSAMGCDIVTGGGPGLMQAANEGELIGDPEGRTRSFGLNIELPHEQATNPFVEKLYTHRTFFTRLHHFVRLSHAFVVLEGGIGTSLEAFMVWQLCQVRHLYDSPLVLVGGMWHELRNWARTHMLQGDPNLADPPDLDLPTCVDTVDDAVVAIRRHKESLRDDRQS